MTFLSKGRFILNFVIRSNWQNLLSVCVTIKGSCKHYWFSWTRLKNHKPLSCCLFMILAQFYVAWPSASVMYRMQWHNEDQCWSNVKSIWFWFREVGFFPFSLSDWYFLTSLRLLSNGCLGSFFPNLRSGVPTRNSLDQTCFWGGALNWVNAINKLITQEITCTKLRELSQLVNHGLALYVCCLVLLKYTREIITLPFWRPDIAGAPVVIDQKSAICRKGGQRTVYQETTNYLSSTANGNPPNYRLVSGFQVGKTNFHVVNLNLPYGWNARKKHSIWHVYEKFREVMTLASNLQAYNTHF